MTTSKATDILNEIHAAELAALRAERDQALADLRATTRECEILRSIPSLRGRAAGAQDGVPPCMRNSRCGSARDERMAMLEHVVRTLDAAVYDIVHRHECWRLEESRDDECGCPVCMGHKALKTVENWRFGGFKERPASRLDGAAAERLNDHHPREMRMHAAWSARASDHLLAGILRDECPAPSARDWYVATSVMQWLGSNCGTDVLDRAGFKYQHYDEDHAGWQQRIDAQLAPGKKALEAQTDRTP